MARITGLETLPLEVVSHIVQYLENRDLKCLRATDHGLYNVCTPRLFETFDIFPHRGSLQDLLSISRCDLRYHVKKLRYETRYRDLPALAEKRLRAVWSSRISKTDMEAVREIARQDNMGSLLCDNPNDDRVQLSMLQEALSDLPDVRSIKIIGPKTHSEGECTCDRIHLPGFYARMLSRTCNKFPDTRLEHDEYRIGMCSWGASCLAPLFEAARVLPRGLTEVILDDVHIFHILNQLDYPRNASMHRRTIASVKRFELNSLWDSLYFPSIILDLMQMLEQMKELKELHLILRKSTISFNDRYPSAEASIRLEQPRPFYSGPLRQLSLFGLTVTTRQFQVMLEPYIDSLETLSLGDVILIPTSRHGPRACIVGLFKWIKENFTRLSEVHLQNGFYNCGMQHWYALQCDPSIKGIRSDLEAFLVHEGDCPLDSYAVPEDYFDVGIKDDSPTLRRKAREEISLRSDETWFMETIKRDDISSPVSVGSVWDDDDVDELDNLEADSDD